MDLAEWYAAGRWVGLLELIDNLPTACRLNEAVANDPESATMLAEMRLRNSGDVDAEEWAPRLSEFDLQATMTQALISEVKALRQALLAVNGNKPGSEKPFPSPRTEIDRAIKAAERAWTETFVSQFGFDKEDI